MAGISLERYTPGREAETRGCSGPPRRLPAAGQLTMRSRPQRWRVAPAGVASSLQNSAAWRLDTAGYQHTLGNDAVRARSNRPNLTAVILLIRERLP